MSKGGTVLGVGVMAILGFVVVKLMGKERPPIPCEDMGDVDGDGVVTHEDAALIAEWLVGNVTLTDEQLRRADVSGDGEVTISDAMLIEQYVQGIIDVFPVCQ